MKLGLLAILLNNGNVNKSLKFYITPLLDGVLVGWAAGLAATVFLHLLAFCTQSFTADPQLLWYLPLAGLVTGLLYQYLGNEAKQGNHLIIDEIHRPKKQIPLIMAPLIFVTTLLTHLFGGSAGREGTSVQMGASLADALGRVMNVSKERRSRLLVAGMGAGFGAAIGTPLAGAVFGMEVLRVGRLRPIAVIESLVAAYVGHYVAYFLRAPHTVYPQVDFYFTWTSCIYLIVASIIFGFLARFFIFCAHSTEKLSQKIIPIPALRPFIFGMILIGLFKLEGTTRLNGLGLNQIVYAFETNVETLLPFLKTFFTALTVGAGFKGGEFTPLAFIGATAGSSLANYFPVSTSLFAALGFAAVFGAASKTPIACAIMAAELFGVECLPYALVACFIAHHCAGMTSIYQHQEHDSLVLISRFKRWFRDYKRNGSR